MQDGKLKEKVFSGLVWKFAERFLAQFVSFVVSVVLARILSPDDYGIIAMILIFITIADVFITSGFSTALIQKKDADEIDFSTNFYCSLAVSIVLYLILFFIAPIIAKFYETDILKPILRVFALRILFGAYNSIQHAYVARHMLFKRFFFSTLFGTIMSGGVGIVLALYGLGPWALVAQYLTNTIVDMIVLNFTIPWKPKLQFSIGSAKKMMDYGGKVLGADLLGTFFDQLRSLIIGKIYTSADLAYYNKGQQFPSLISNNISTSIMSVLFPAISNINDDVDRVKQMLRRAVSIMSYVMFPLLVGLAVTAKQLVIILFTEKWIQCVPYIQIFAITSAVGLIGTIGLQAMKAVGRSDILLKLEFVKKPVYLLLLLLGAKISVLYVAITMFIYTVYSMLVNACQLKKIANYGLREQLGDIASATILSSCMFIIVYPLNNLNINNIIILFFQFFTAVLFYVVFSKIFKVSAFYYLLDFFKGKRKGKENNDKENTKIN